MTDGNEFAYSIEYRQKYGSEDQFETLHTEGLTKREYFAAMAMQGLCTTNGILPEIVKEAVRFSDALINALNK